jgi:hypothetical protein
VAIMGIKFLPGLAAASFLMLAMTGCSFGVACPAMGWTNTVDIHFDGNASDVAVAEFCVDGVCGSSAPSSQTSSEVLQLPTLGVSRIDERNWQASLDMSTPATVTVRALSSSGQVLAETVADLQWTRSGGNERCGGPSTPAPVNLEIPS